MAETPQERPDAEEILRESGPLIENDHFVCISGEHGSGWIDKDVRASRSTRPTRTGASSSRPAVTGPERERSRAG
jgi:hypothetical protein